MSLSERFGKAEEKHRSGGQKPGKTTAVVVQSSQPPRGPKGGVKKAQQGKNGQNAAKGKQNGGKKQNAGQKGGKKSTSIRTFLAALPLHASRLLTSPFAAHLSYALQSTGNREQ